MLFKRGQSFLAWNDTGNGIAESSETLLDIEHNNVLIGAYGTSGAAPKIKYVRPVDNADCPTIAIGSPFYNITIQDLDFDTDASSAGVGDAIAINSSRNVTIRNNTFTSAHKAINASNHPDGLLVQDNTVPPTNGLDEYFLWLESADTVVLGNTVSAGSEYAIRCGFNSTAPINRLLIAQNNLQNRWKSNLRIQAGSYAYVDSNTLSGSSMETGPQDDPDGETMVGARLRYAVVTGNSLDDDGLTDKFIRIDTGVEHILYKNNTITRQYNSTQAFLIDGIMGGAFTNRSVKDINIVNNTLVNNSTSNSMSFAHLGTNATGYTVTPEVTIANNLYYAPHLSLGTNSGILVISHLNAVVDGGLSHNVWPDTGTGTAMNIAGTGVTKSDYQTNYSAKVSSETFSNVTVDSSFTPSSGANAAATFDGVFVDKNGTPRPSSGDWTAGAVQLPSIPAAPSSPAASAVSSSQINVSWTDNSNNETGFRIDRSTDSSFSSGNTVTVTTTATSYSFTGLSASTTYYFRVRAYNAAGDSSNTSSVNATTSASSSDPKLTGTGFGTAGSWNNSGNTFDKALDGNASTFFDAPDSIAYVGLDLGTAKVITAVHYTARFNSSSRMVGGRFQGSNDNSSWTDLYTISADPGNSSQPVTITNSTAFRYVRYISAADGYGNVAELSFFGY